MKIKQWTVSAFVLVGLALTACGGVYTTPSLAYRPLGSKSEPTMNQVTQAVMRAGSLRQWKMKLIRPGLAEARREWSGGKHIIVVNVVYDTKKYRIDHKSSKNLKYGGSVAHNSYNRFTVRLYDEVYRQTSKL